MILWIYILVGIFLRYYYTLSLFFYTSTSWWLLHNSRSPLFFRNICIFQANLSRAVIWMVSILHGSVPWFYWSHLAFVPGRDQWQAKIHITLGFLASWIIDKHRFTLYLVNQWQAMTWLDLVFGPGEAMTSSAWVSAHALLPHVLIFTLRRPCVKSYLVGGTDKCHSFHWSLILPIFFASFFSIVLIVYYYWYHWYFDVL